MTLSVKTMFVAPVKEAICALVSDPLLVSTITKSATVKPFVAATSIVVPATLVLMIVSGVVPALKVITDAARSLDAIAPTTRVCIVGEVAKNVTAVLVPDAVCVTKSGDPTCAVTGIVSPIARAAVRRISLMLFLSFYERPGRGLLPGPPGQAYV